VILVNGIMTKYEIHKSLTHTVLSAEAQGEDVLLYMVLLHTHDLYLKPGVVLEDVIMKDVTKPLLLPAITRRHAAEVVASLWSSADKRGAEDYWYSLFIKTTPYEVLSDVPTPSRERVMELKELLLCDPRVEAVLEA
jgi:hypothetical protein